MQMIFDHLQKSLRGEEHTRAAAMCIGASNRCLSPPPVRLKPPNQFSASAAVRSNPPNRFSVPAAVRSNPPNRFSASAAGSLETSEPIFSLCRGSVETAEAHWRLLLRSVLRTTPSYCAALPSLPPNASFGKTFCSHAFLSRAADRLRRSWPCTAVQRVRLRASGGQRA